MGLSPKSYAALLLAADFVQLRSDGVRLNKKEIDEKWMKRDIRIARRYSRMFGVYIEPGVVG